MHAKALAAHAKALAAHAKALAAHAKALAAHAKALAAHANALLLGAQLSSPEVAMHPPSSLLTCPFAGKSLAPTAQTAPPDVQRLFLSGVTSRLSTQLSGAGCSSQEGFQQLPSRLAFPDGKQQLLDCAQMGRSQAPGVQG